MTVTANNPIEPVAGGLVTFTPPASGASAELTGNPATISASGTASVTATSNGVAGSYTVSATANGAPGAASFSLTNVALVSIAVSPGNPELAEGVAGQFTATGTYADGSTGDITRFVTWASATPSVATISGTGAGLGPGPGDQRDHRVTGGRHQPRRHLDRDCPQLRGHHHRRQRPRLAPPGDPRFQRRDRSDQHHRLRHLRSRRADDRACSRPCPRSPSPC